jgi:hypothetical protein
VRLGDVAFPYRAERPFGLISFAFVFAMLVIEIEVVVFIGLAVVAHRAELFIDLQQAILPAAVLVSLVASAVFAWRARAWTRARIAGLREWNTGAAGAYGEKIAARRGSS